MEPILDELYKEPTLDSNSLTQLKSAASWSRSIGWMYVVFALIIALICVVVVFNLDSLMEYLYVMLGRNDLVMRFLQDYGTSLFIVFSLMSILVLLFYAYNYLSYGKNIHTLDSTSDEVYLERAFRHFDLILIFGIITGVMSMLVTLVATLLVFI